MICLLALSFGAVAKAQTGVYMNATDFKNNKLSAMGNSRHGKTKIRPHDFCGNASFIIIHDGIKSKYNKDKIFGYRDADNMDYRFYDKIPYRIAESGSIFIYELDEHIPQSKGFKTENRYYFSITADGSIYPLTPSNLKYAFKDNSKFVDRLDTYFNSYDISEYDTIHKTFLINSLFKQSIQ